MTTGAPGNYSPNRTCKWRIVLTSGSLRMQITFAQFNAGSGDSVPGTSRGRLIGLLM